MHDGKSTIPPALRKALPETTDLGTITLTTFGALTEVEIHGCGDFSADTIVAILPGWLANDGNWEVAYPDAEFSLAAAETYVDDGDWGDGSSTAWINVRTWRRGYALADEDSGTVVMLDIDAEDHTITKDPLEPECADGHTHDWQSPYSVLGGLRENPGVWGHGGGVIIKEVCAHCGQYRITDTWAQNPATGEQGLESVSYTDADQESAAWVAQN